MYQRRAEGRVALGAGGGIAEALIRFPWRLPVSTLKYGGEMTGLCDCPPADAGPASPRGAFRFVHADMADARNFVPPAKLTPTRWINRSPECSDFALSLFETPGQARTFYGELAKTFKKIGTAIGTHLAEVTLQASDGMVTPADPDGHFDLHEDASADLAGSATALGPVGGPHA